MSTIETHEVLAQWNRSRKNIKTLCPRCTTPIANLRPGDIGGTPNRTCKNGHKLQITIPADWVEFAFVSIVVLTPATTDDGTDDVPAPVTVEPDPTTNATIEWLREEIAQLHSRLGSAESEVQQLKEGGNGSAPSKTYVFPAAGDMPDIVVDGSNRHPLYDELVKTLEAGKLEGEAQAYIQGPAGSGKTHIVQQLAKDRGVRFASQSFTEGVSESKLLGFMSASGEYLPASFITLFEEGGIYLCDEIDRADPNVISALNSALANGFISVPARTDNPMAYRHADFYCVAAGNTFGEGGSALYNSTNKQDGALMDRFVMKILSLDYDESFERAMGEAAGIMGFVDAIWAIRKNLKEGHVQKIAGSRAIKHAGQLAVMWREVGDAERVTTSNLLDRFFMGWDEASKAKALDGVVIRDVDGSTVDGSDVDGSTVDGETPAPVVPGRQGVGDKCPRCQVGTIMRKTRRRDGRDFKGCSTYVAKKGAVPARGCKWTASFTD